MKLMNSALLEILLQNCLTFRARNLLQFRVPIADIQKSLKEQLQLRATLLISYLIDTLNEEVDISNFCKKALNQIKKA